MLVRVIKFQNARICTIYRLNNSKVSNNQEPLLLYLIKKKLNGQLNSRNISTTLEDLHSLNTVVECLEIYRHFIPNIFHVKPIFMQ